MADVDILFEVATRTHRDDESDRYRLNNTIRLVFCAWCRSIWDKLTGEMRSAIQYAEKYAYGTGDILIMNINRVSYMDPLGSPDKQAIIQLVHMALCSQLRHDPVAIAIAAGVRPSDMINILNDIVIGAMIIQINHNETSAMLVDDIMRSNNNHLDKLTILALADSLEECDADKNAIAHLRGHDEHYRGCWVINSILKSRPYNQQLV